MKKLISYIAIDKEDKAIAFYLKSTYSKGNYPEDEYTIYEVSSISEIYDLFSSLGYDDEYIENFIEYRISDDEHLALAQQDHMED